MQRFMSKRVQLVGAIMSIIIWTILVVGLLYALLTNQFPTVEGKVTCGIVVIISILLLVSSARFYWKNRDKKKLRQS
jgi:membrane protein DedA with SNARE-associated domain